MQGGNSFNSCPETYCLHHVSDANDHELDHHELNRHNVVPGNALGHGLNLHNVVPGNALGQGLNLNNVVPGNALGHGLNPHNVVQGNALGHGLNPHNVVPGNALGDGAHVHAGWICHSSSGVIVQNQVNLEELTSHGGWLSSAGANNGSSQMLEGSNFAPNHVPPSGSVNGHGLIMHGPPTLGSARSDAIPRNIDLNVACGVEEVVQMDNNSSPSPSGQHLRCKRKAPEEPSVQLPHVGNISSTQQAENSDGQAIPPPNITSTDLNIYSPVNNIPNASQDGHVNPRPASGMTGVNSNMHRTSSLEGNAESLYRNIRLRRSTADRQVPTPARLSLLGRFVHVPSSSQTVHHVQRNRIIGLTSGSMPSISPTVPVNGSPVLLQQESLIHVPIPTSQSMFISEIRRGNLGHLSNSPSTITSSSQTGPRAVAQPPASEVSQQNITEGAQNGSAAGLQLSAPPPGNSAEGYEQRLPRSRNQTVRISAVTMRDLRAARNGDPRAMQALLRPGLLMTRAQRHNIPMATLLQPLLAAERRNRLVSEVRRVMELLRSVDALNFEDNMVIDGLLFTEDIENEHDMHEDMRLDIDSMSYEEILDLEDQIGSVNTGLSEEAILTGLRPQSYQPNTSGPRVEEPLPCCICLDEYLEGQEIGKLNCRHEFHFDCIKQWLLQKNSCPVCKLTALHVGGRNT